LKDVGSRSGSLYLQSISVPKTLADRGFSPEVAAQRLRDAINTVQEGAKDTIFKSEMANPARRGPELARFQAESLGVDVQDYKRTVTISFTDNILDRVANWVSYTILRQDPGYEISGEFIILSAGELSLRLRLNGRTVFGDLTKTSNDPKLPEGADDPKAADALISAGAQAVIRQTARPNLKAWLLFGEGDLPGAEAILNNIIASSAPHAEVIKHAYNLKGLIERKAGSPSEAIAAYRKAIELDSHYPTPHVGLGNLFYGQGKLHEAAIEYRMAIDLDASYAAPRNNLGNVLSDQKKLDEAVAEYRKAIDLDASFAAPHSNLGDLLRDQEKLDAAAVEYRKAIDLDASFAAPHNGLGNVLSDLDEAAAEYRKAIDLDASDAYPHNGLGNLLRDQRKLDEAAAEYRKAIDLDASDAAPYGNLGTVLREITLSRPTTAGKRLLLLREACAAFVRGQMLAPADRSNRAGIRQIDLLLHGRDHCPAE
jgi:tetratricopeptide (TPR) repeat protein